MSVARILQVTGTQEARIPCSRSLRWAKDVGTSSFKSQKPRSSLVSHLDACDRGVLGKGWENRVQQGTHRFQVLLEESSCRGQPTGGQPTGGWTAKTVLFWEFAEVNKASILIPPCWRPPITMPGNTPLWPSPCSREPFTLMENL